jgi:lysophospholipase L1-like esterase
MSGMQREVPTTEAPHSPLVIELVQAMLGDGPVDPALLAKVTEPERAQARAEAEAQLRAEDWPNLGRYQASNAALVESGVRPDVVFMGDSISEIWPEGDPEFFAKGRVCRGISGQTSPQILLRFYADVIALKPKAVHLLCGSNDIAGNTGPTTPYRYQCNVLAMTECAAAHGIRVLLGSITPAAFFSWRPEASPASWVAELNVWLRNLAGERGFTFVDYHPPLDDGTGAMRREFTHDGVHPNRRGYAVMRQVLEPLL